MKTKMEAGDPRTLETLRIAQAAISRAPLWQTGVCLLLLLGHVGGAKADTYVSGPIGGQTWTTNGSPYRVIGDIHVSLLTIKPGVTVYFQSNYQFVVDAFLTATGTASAPITFTRTNGGGWRGIFFNYCGDGSEMDNCRISGVQGNSAIICVSANPVLRSNVVYSNASGGEAGGLYIDNSGYPGGEMLVQDCVFTNNTSASHGGAVSAHTGNSTIRFVGCSFIRNTANPSQTSLNPVVGGGVYLVGNGSFETCIFDQNSVYTYCSGYWCSDSAHGGGLYWSGNGSMKNTIIQNNTCRARADGSNFSVASYGGGAYLSGVLLLQNCVLAYNTASASGGYPSGDPRAGGIYQASGSLRMINCTLAYNNIEGYRLDGGTCSIVNSIFYFNNGNGTQIVGSPPVTYSDVQGGYAGTGNTVWGPAFADASALTLAPGSRCIDAGDPNPIYNDLCFPPSLGGVRNDMGAYGGPGACWWNAGEEPTIVSQPRSQSGCLGQRIILGVTATGSETLSYQWYFNGSPLVGQTGTNLVIASLVKTNAGSYQVVVSNVFGSATSAPPAALTVYDACIDLHMYAGLSISGQQGASYVLSYSTDLSNTNGWVPMATNTMGPTGWFYLDMDSPFSPYRFYKAMLKP